MRLHVCFLGTTRYPTDLPRHLSAKFELLGQIGEVTVIALSSGCILPRRLRGVASFYLVPAIAPAPLRYLLFVLVAAAVLPWLVFRRGVSVIVCQSPTDALPAILARWLGRALGRPVRIVIEGHSDFEVPVGLSRRSFVPGLTGRLVRWCARFTLQRADAARAVSVPIAEQLRRFGASGRIVCFPAWVDLRPFLKVSERRSPKAGTLVFVGVLSPLKGIQDLIAAVAEVKRVHSFVRLLIVGREGKRGWRRYLGQVACESGISGDITFLGDRPQFEVAEVLSEAAALVLPSKSEGLPRVILEAMAARVPVVATSVGGITEIITDQQTGLLVPPGSVNHLASALRWLVENPEGAEVMARRAQEFARSAWSPSVYLEGYRKLLVENRQQCHLPPF